MEGYNGVDPILDNWTEIERETFRCLLFDKNLSRTHSETEIRKMKEEK